MEHTFTEDQRKETLSSTLRVIRMAHFVPCILIKSSRMHARTRARGGRQELGVKLVGGPLRAAMYVMFFVQVPKPHPTLLNGIVIKNLSNES